MGTEDLTFTVVSTGDKILDPLQLSGSLTQTIRVTNYGSEDLEDLGIFIRPATSLGEVDYPADHPPETDYQDLLTWGQATVLGIAPQGGIKFSLPQNDGSTLVAYVTRGAGHLMSSKLPVKDIDAGAYVDIVIVLESPPATPARRLFIDMVIE